MQPDNSKSPSKASARRVSRGTLAAIAAVVVVLVLIAGLVLMVRAEATATVRDLFIILMALVMLFIGVMLLALVYQVAALTRMLRDEIKPLLQNAEDTVNTARGATMFVSERVVQPMIGVAGAMAGIARVVSLLGELRRPRR